MKEIQLSQGQVALVDDEDFEWLSKWKWCAQKDSNTYYACRSYYNKGKKCAIKMHRQLLGLTNPKILCDHRNNNGLDNQRVNLRICTKTENNRNKSSNKISSSKYVGVFFVTTTHKTFWRAQITDNGNRKHLGCFKTEELAALARNEAAKIYHGEFAHLNKIP